MNSKLRGVIAPVTAALALLSGPVAAQETMPRVTLQEAVQRALRVSPAIAQSEGAVTTAESAQRSALGAFLPSLSLSSGSSLSASQRWDANNQTWVNGQSNDSYSAGINSSLTLFTAGRRGAERRRTAAQTKNAEAALVEQRFNVALAAKQAFFAVLRADESTLVSQARLKRAEENLGAAERRIQVGSATQSDRLRAQLELNQAKQALITAQATMRNATIALGRQVGMDGPVGAVPMESLAPRPLTLTEEQLEAIVVSHSPAVVTASATLEANEASVRVARAQYFPSISASGGYDWSNQDPQIKNGRTSWSTRLSLSFPLFNGFSREDAVTRAGVNARNARFALEDARRGARVELGSALSALRLAEEQIQLSEEAVRVAAEDLRVQQERYRVGVATMLEQMASQTALAEAENNLVAARYDYQIARAQLEALAGREL